MDESGNDAYLKQLNKACQEMRESCDGSCIGIGYCDAVFNAVRGDYEHAK